MDMVDQCELIDLEFVGPQYTWSNMRKGIVCGEEKIDRCFCNQAWLHLFPGNRVSHLPPDKIRPSTLVGSSGFEQS